MRTWKIHFPCSAVAKKDWYPLLTVGGQCTERGDINTNTGRGEGGGRATDKQKHLSREARCLSNQVVLAPKNGGKLSSAGNRSPRIADFLLEAIQFSATIRKENVQRTRGNGNDP